MVDEGGGGFDEEEGNEDGGWWLWCCDVVRWWWLESERDPRERTRGLSPFAFYVHVCGVYI